MRALASCRNGLLCALALLACTPLWAQQTAPMSNPLFAQPVELSGTLGGQKVRMHLQPKADEIDSVEGDYLTPAGERNAGKRILLAGEIAQNKFSLEESEDGKDVSGQWDVDVQGDQIRGVWLSADGSVSQDFNLQIQRQMRQKLHKSTSKPASQ
jgi:hypothetical protein